MSAGSVRLNFRIQALATERTDLVCILCGQFRTEFAIVPPGGSDDDAQTGIHKKCVAGEDSLSGADMSYVLVTYASERPGVGPSGEPVRLVSGRKEQGPFESRIEAGLRWWGFIWAHPDRMNLSWLEERP